jgi:hypothetical protein
VQGNHTPNPSASNEIPNEKRRSLSRYEHYKSPINEALMNNRGEAQLCPQENRAEKKEKKEKPPYPSQQKEKTKTAKELLKESCVFWFWFKAKLYLGEVSTSRSTHTGARKVYT